MKDFSKAKQGRTLWSIQLGKCIVQYKTEEMILCWAAKTENEFAYRIDGRASEGDHYPSLFLEKPRIKVPKRKAVEGKPKK